MFEKDWPILLVDDDPDVLAISKLAMKRFEVDGRAIRLFTATSKAQAINLLDTSLSGGIYAYVAVAFIDVVMETDTAGLELCRYIRETQQNRLTQLFIRTGQPGIAPEREVIDRYDINGYFTKAELTEDKLYSLVKAGVRQFDFGDRALGMLKVLARVIPASSSPGGLERELQSALEQMPLDAAGNPHDIHLQVSMMAGDRVLAGKGYTPAAALAERDRLVGLGLQPLNTTGDSYVIDGNDCLFKAAAGDGTDETYILYNLAAPANPSAMVLTRVFAKALRGLAKLAPPRPRQRVARAG